MQGGAWDLEKGNLVCVLQSCYLAIDDSIDEKRGSGHRASVDEARAVEDESMGSEVDLLEKGTYEQ